MRYPKQLKWNEDLSPNSILSEWTFSQLDSFSILSFLYFSLILLQLVWQIFLLHLQLNDISVSLRQEKTMLNQTSWQESSIQIFEYSLLWKKILKILQSWERRIWYFDEWIYINNCWFFIQTSWSFIFHDYEMQVLLTGL